MPKKRSGDDVVREEQLNVRLSDKELACIQKMAAHHGLRPPELVRMLAKKEEALLARQGARGFERTR